MQEVAFDAGRLAPTLSTAATASHCEIDKHPADSNRGLLPILMVHRAMRQVQTSMTPNLVLAAGCLKCKNHLCIVVAEASGDVLTATYSPPVTDDA